MGEAYEFFTSSPCLLVHDSKMEWLKNNLWNILNHTNQ
jgi:hypothetical protein